MPHQVSTLHFDLSGFSPDLEFRLLGGANGDVPLARYADAPNKLDEHHATNAALALMSEPQVGQFTHYLENVDSSTQGVALQRVVFPSLDEHPLPEIAMTFLQIGEDDIMRALSRMPCYLEQRLHNLALSTYGVDAEATFANYVAVHLAAGSIKPPGVTAQTLVLQHPEIGTVNGSVAKYVLDSYVSDGAEFGQLVEYLQKNGPGSEKQWYNKSWAMWAQNNDGTGPLVPAEVNLDLKFKDGATPDWPTPAGGSAPGMPTYVLTDENDPPTKVGSGTGVIGAAAPVVQKVLKLTKDDDTLQGLLWSKQSGTTAKESTNEPSVYSVAAAAKTDTIQSNTPKSKGFAVRNTAAYGLSVYEDESTFNYDKKTFSLPVKNWPSRYLGVYVQFFGADGAAIKREAITAANPNNPDKPFIWEDRLPLELVRKFVEPSDTKNYLTWLSSGSAVFGAPVPFLTQRADLDFLWPDDATSAKILLGGLGCAGGFADWDSDVDIVGVLGTALICYGVGVLTMVAGVYLNPYIEAFRGKEAEFFYAVCGVVGANTLIIGALLTGFGYGFGKTLLALLSNVVSSVIFSQLSARGIPAAAGFMARVTAALVGGMTAEQVLQQVPVVGWALKVASIAADLASLTATTTECVLSPATYSLQIDRTMDLTVTVSPDPAHGKKDFNPVWPLVSDHYVVQVRYPAGAGQDGGTTYTKSGPMPGKHDEPIKVIFDGIPAGGKVDVHGNVYSETDWLCGHWSSGWINANPDRQNALATGGAIKELLVPLTPTTAYSQKQALAYSSGKKHHWKVTRFSIAGGLVAEFDKGGSASSAIVSAFAENGNDVNGGTITVEQKGSKWRLTATEAFTIESRTVVASDNPDGVPQLVLTVQNTTDAAPPLPEVYPLPAGPTGNRLGALQNIIHNNSEYSLGYSWMAAGQNLPMDDGDQPENVPMYAMQSISTLGRPQDQIIEPTRGFSLSTFIAYDQFGLTELFPIDAALAKELTTGQVSEAIAAEFRAFGYELPVRSTVSVVKPDLEWLVADSAEQLYQLRMRTEDDGKKHIAVYAYPIPGLDNFYLDPRDHTSENPVYYLRGVDLSQPPGEYAFDYDKSKAWGRIVNEGSLQGLCVHPHGYVVGVDFTHHKLFTLKLPAEAMKSEESPYAMPLSGEGVREGLLKNPQALSIASDGRILILEEGNRRIQAFDVKGNPVPCFAAGQPSFTAARSFAGELDGHNVTPELVELFQRNTVPSLAPKFAVSDPGQIISELDAGTVAEKLVVEFRHAGYAADTDTAADYQVTPTAKGKLWLVHNSRSQATFDLRLAEDRYEIDNLYIYLAPALSLTTRAKGLSWLIEDTVNSSRYEATAPVGGADLKIQRLMSFMPLRADQNNLTYLDLAVEPKGYIYVLMVRQLSSGPEFLLDIYNPDGSVLLDKPQTGVNAARLTIDQWRSMFTLNFNTVLGPNNRTEPGVSQWQPSTPGPTPAG